MTRLLLTITKDKCNVLHHSALFHLWLGIPEFILNEAIVNEEVLNLLPDEFVKPSQKIQ